MEVIENEIPEVPQIPQVPQVLRIAGDVPIFMDDQLIFRDQRREEDNSVWNNLHLLNRELVLSMFRFDIESKYFEDFPEKDLIFNEDHEQIIEESNEFYKSSGNLVNIICQGKIFKINKNLVCYHSTAFKTIINNNLNENNEIQMRDIDYDTISLIFALLLNPGKINTFTVHLTRANVLKKLLDASEILQISQIKTLLENNIQNFIKVYKTLAKLYAEVYNSKSCPPVRAYFNHRHRNGGDPADDDNEAETYKQKFMSPPGRYAVENVNSILILLDKHNMFDAIEEILSFVHTEYKSFAEIPIIHNIGLQSKTYIAVIKILEKNAGDSFVKAVMQAAKMNNQF